MRYEDWDILLFPRDCKVPVKEFKVACHVVHDNEFAHTHGSVGLPTVCCFVPSIPPGSLYKLSIHSWSTPPVSQFTRTYSKYLDDMTFEARLFVDGQLVSSISFERDGPWPNVMKHSFELPSSREMEPLKFPAFRRELLQQNYWSPADDLGRIKLIISEAFPRDSVSNPKERVKNVVAFAFQHAPLDVLESSCIAWPNPSMWRTMPFTSSLNLPSQPFEDAESHAHSPRGRYGSGKSLPSTGQTENSLRARLLPSSQQQKQLSATSTQENPNPSTPVSMGADPFIEANAYFEWLNGMGMGLNNDILPTRGSRQTTRNDRKSSTDVSMPDYLPSDQVIQLNGDSFDLKHDEDSSTIHMKVPTNTPTACSNELVEQGGTPYPILPHSSSLPPGLANSLTNSLLNQPVPIHVQHVGLPFPSTEVRSRKETRQQKKGDSPSIPGKCFVHQDDAGGVGEVSQESHAPSSTRLVVANDTTAQEERTTFEATVDNNPARKSEADMRDLPGRRAKRIRDFTPTSSKPFDDEEEPCRASPRVRLTPCAENTISSE